MSHLWPSSTKMVPPTYLVTTLHLFHDKTTLQPTKFLSYPGRQQQFVVQDIAKLEQT